MIKNTYGTLIIEVVYISPGRNNMKFISPRIGLIKFKEKLSCYFLLYICLN